MQFRFSCVLMDFSHKIKSHFGKMLFALSMSVLESWEPASLSLYLYQIFSSSVERGALLLFLDSPGLFFCHSLSFTYCSSFLVCYFKRFKGSITLTLNIHDKERYYWET